MIFKKATQKLIRYDAFNENFVFFEQSNQDLQHPDNHAGCDFAYYYEAHQNIRYPNIEDSLSVSIVSYQRKDYLVDGCTTNPNHHREQFNIATRFSTYEEAKKEALLYIEKAKIFIQQQ